MGFFRPPSTHPDLYEPFPSGHSQVSGIGSDPLGGALSTSSWDLSVGASKCSYQDQGENQQFFPLLTDFAFEKQGIELLLSRIHISYWICVLDSEEHGKHKQECSWSWAQLLLPALPGLLQVWKILHECPMLSPSNFKRSPRSGVSAQNVLEIHRSDNRERNWASASLWVNFQSAVYRSLCRAPTVLPTSFFIFFTSHWQERNGL